MGGGSARGGAGVKSPGGVAKRLKLEVFDDDRPPVFTVGRD